VSLCGLVVLDTAGTVARSSGGSLLAGLNDLATFELKAVLIDETVDLSRTKLRGWLMLVKQ
jgi:hypothetical protein